ncbi:MAG: hypothetical protein KDK54_22545 [Leptospiraceae bacterium]|nr:hypothetical protein [Leptospiraceae bacterium]
MLSTIFKFLLVVLLLTYCKKENANHDSFPTDSSGTKTEEASPNDFRKSIYRAENLQKGIESEYYQVEYDSSFEKIENIWYWNSVIKKTIPIKILNQEYISTEVTGFIGELELPESNSRVKFAVIEDRVTITLSDEVMYEYYAYYPSEE